MGAKPSKRKQSTDNTDTTDSQASSEMSTWFRKQGAEAKKRLQHKLYLARESPDSTFDISGCEISDVPNGVFSLCKVMQKEALLLHMNWLTSLKGGGPLKDLAAMRVLDLHDNCLTSLPEEIGELRSLQVLNLEKNKLKSLPHTIGDLQVLQTLNVKDNKLKTLPEDVCRLQCLRTLDISENNIHVLHRELCQIRTLENLILTPSNMQYPDSELCSQGTEAIMTFLCQESGIEYISPSKFLLNVLEPPNPVVAAENANSNFKATAHDLVFMESLQQYESVKEKKRLDRMALEKQIEEDQRAQAELAQLSEKQKQNLMNQMASEQTRLQGELNQLQKAKDVEHQKMVASLYKVEQSAGYLIQHLLQMNEKAHRMEALLEAMERERMEAEQWFIVRQEEAENLRRKEVIVNMKRILAESETFEELRKAYQNSRDDAAKRAHESINETDDRLDSVLYTKQLEQNDMIQQLIKQESYQKEAFEALQMQKDARHSRIRDQIWLIQEELMRMTVVEMERRDERQDVEQAILSEKREALTKLLVQLLEEKSSRELELRKRLLEMEMRKMDDQSDYWLVQYQRLMDRKPQRLMDMEHHLEFAVIHVLEQAGAEEYKPLFARNRISIETMLQLTDEDLAQMGVRELGLRRSILKHVDIYKTEESMASKKVKEVEEEGAAAAACSPVLPTAPSPAVSPTAPPDEITTRLTPECVVCMNSESDVVFLNCGHVCCCSACSSLLSQCPLCRAAIHHRIKLAKGEPRAL